MPHSSKDYYAVLGVDKNADTATIKSAYKKLAVKYHPDKNPDNSEAEEKFKEAAEADGVLSDPSKRQNYDLGGSETTRFSDPSSWGFNFNQQRKPDRKNFRGPKGANLQVVIELSLREIYEGTSKTINYSHYERCDTCSGFGSESQETVN